MPKITDPNKVTIEKKSVRYDGNKIGKWWGKTLYYIKNDELHYRNFTPLGRIMQCFGYKKKYNEGNLATWLKSKKLVVSTKNNSSSSSSMDEAVKKALDLKSQYISLCSIIDPDNDNTEEITDIIKNGLDVNTILDEDNNTLLHVACKNGRRELVEYLLDNDADVDAVNSAGVSPLHMAVECSVKIPIKRKEDFQDPSLDILVHLVDLCNPDVSDKNGETPLYKACINGDYESTVMLLKTSGGKANVNFIGVNGIPPLNAAIQSGNINLVELLIERGADVNEEKGNIPPLNAAAQSGNIELVKLLIKNGADKNLKDKNGIAAAVVAFQKGFVDIFNYFQLEVFADMPQKDD